MSDLLDTLLEAVEHLPHAVYQLNSGCLYQGCSVCAVVAEVRKARGEAVAWLCDRHGLMAAPNCTTSLSGKMIDMRPECSQVPLYSAPPATVPRANVEKLAEAAHHHPFCAGNPMGDTPCACGLDAALRDLGMEAKRG